MKKAKLHGLPPPPPLLYPIIEITGVPDCGKKLIAELVAKRISAKVIHCPYLDVQSFTGQAILHTVINNPKQLEVEPYWWCHVYAANLQEVRKMIKAYQKISPVVITNYTTGFSLWSKAMGVSNLIGFYKDLPFSNLAIGLHGAYWETPGNITNNFSLRFHSNLEFHVRKRCEPKYKKVEMGKSKKMWEEFNIAATEITSIIKERFGLHVEEGYLFTPTLKFTK